MNAGGSFGIQVSKPSATRCVFYESTCVEHRLYSSLCLLYSGVTLAGLKSRDHTTRSIDCSKEKVHRKTFARTQDFLGETRETGLAEIR